MGSWLKKLICVVSAFLFIGGQLTIPGARADSLGTSGEPIFSEISAGYDHTCGLKDDGYVECWGWIRPGGYARLAVPKDLGRVTQIASGDDHSCAITLQKLVRCWGANDEKQLDVPPELGQVSLLAAGQDQTCAVEITNAIRCWPFEPSSMTLDGDAIVKISVGKEYVCALGSLGGARCWRFSSVAREWNLPVNDLYPVIEITAGGWQVCAIRENSPFGAYCRWDSPNLPGNPQFGPDVQNPSRLYLSDSHSCITNADGVLVCWGENDFGQASVPENLGPVKDVALGSHHTCALKVNGGLTCWGDNSEGQTSGPLKFSVPADPPWLRVEQKDGFFIVEWHHDPKETDGTLTWKLRNETDGVDACEIRIEVVLYRCDVYGLMIGKQYIFSLQGENEAGKTGVVRSQAEKFCPVLPPSMEISNPEYSSALVGSAITVRGTLNNFCGDLPKSYEVRYQESGKSWTKWAKGLISTSGNFSYKKTISVNTNIQIRVTTADGYMSASIKVGAKIKAKAPISITWTATKNKQGFNQGGLITAKFSGDAVYSGKCVIVGETARAYNFALVGVGKESKYVGFQVLKGKGTGKLQMKWNGKSKIGVLCSSSKFEDIFVQRDATFKANF
jgi:hypothetical protein